MKESDLWLVKTRSQAIAGGRNKYWTGKKCARGHESQRYTSSGICCKCNYENSQTYQKRRTNQLRGIDDPMIRVSVMLHRDQEQALRDYANILNGGKS